MPHFLYRISAERIGGSKKVDMCRVINRIKKRSADNAILGTVFALDLSEMVLAGQDVGILLGLLQVCRAMNFNLS